MVEDNQLLLTPNSEPPRLTLPYAATTTDQTVTVPPANMHTDVTTVAGPTRAKAVQEMGSSAIFKLLPWTPLRLFILEYELSYYSTLTKSLLEELYYNLRHGCTIGYTGPQFTYLASNLQSAYQQPEVIDTTLKDECEAGRILGPFDEPPLPNFRPSGLGLVPKHDGGWRIIYHLSAPFAQSINDFIDSQLYSLSYCTIDDAYKILNELGPRALMSKIDL